MFLGRAPYAKSDYGTMWELDAIAAVVIGGTSLFGGRGTILGTFLGVLLLKLINNGLTLAQLNTFWQMIVLGMIILLAVGIDIVRQSATADKIRQVLLAVAATMVLFAGINPMAHYFSGKAQLIEHSSMSALVTAGESLSSTQQSRLLDVDDFAVVTEQVATNGPTALIMLLLTVAAFASLASKRVNIGWGVVAIVVLAGALLTLGGWPGVPVFVLGLVAALGSLGTDTLF